METLRTLREKTIGERIEHGGNCRLSVIGLGLALGITWAFAIFFLGIIAWLFGWGVAMVHLFGSFYIGYTPTFLGAIFGAIWGFFDCFIAGVIIAWLYNLVVGKVL